MKQLNLVRMILGGLLSGVILYVFEGVTNTLILGSQWKSWGLIANQVFATPPEGLSLTYWAIQALIAGLAGTFVYAAIRAWVGVNLRAAYISALVVWATGWLGMAMDQKAMGLEPPILVYGNLLAALLGLLAGQIAASFVYKEGAVSVAEAEK